MNVRFKKTIIILIAVISLVLVAGISSVVSFADEYYTVSVEYRFEDESFAYDPYKAIYAKGSDIDVQITNPVIPGYKAVESKDSNVNKLKTEIKFSNLSEDKKIVVYYVPAEVNYRVRYYFQNIENDLYTERLDLDASYTDKSGITGTYPEELENIQFEGFTTLFHEPDAIAADGSTIFQIYYDRNYVLINFDLDGGYGVEPIYAKYNTLFNIAEPNKRGYVFKGWRDENGNISKFTGGVVPAEDVTYTAVWEAVETDFTIIYWTENLNGTGYSFDRKSAGRALSGTEINSNAYVDGWTNEDKSYFIYDSTRAETKIVEGDGSTIINIYFKRRVYTLKFYYARETEVINSAANNNSITSNEYYYIYNVRANKMLSSIAYNDNNNHLSLGGFEKFKFIEVSGGYHVKNEQGYYLTIDSETAGITLTPTIININKNTSGTWTLSRNGSYLNDFAQQRSHAAGWKSSSASSDHGSQWRIVSDYTSSKTSQVCFTTNGFNANLENGRSVIKNEGINWVATENNTIPELSERYNKTKGIEQQLTGLYHYFTIEVKYGESLAGKWPLKDMEGVKNSDGSRLLVFGSWNPESDSYYYSVKDQLFNGNDTIKGEYQKLDKFIMHNNQPEITTIHFLSFWANANSGGHKAREWIYNIYVPVLDDASVSEPHTYDNVTYRKYKTFHTYDTNDNIAEQTPTALDGFEYKERRSVDNGFITLNGENIKTYDANFYYERLSYNLEFSGYNEETVTLPYETKLSSYYFEPEYPDENQKDFYKFGGWYTTEECYEGTEFDFSEKAEMPANSVILFAKWEKIKHNVTFYNDYNDYTQRENALSSVEVVHNELIITSDVPTQLTPPTDDAQFTGWYYYDNKNNKVRFDPQSIPVTKEYHLFAEWSSRKTAKYLVKYVEKGTDTPVADNTDGTAFIGKTKTFQAKGNTELNAAHAWNEGGTNWWPIVPSHSILIDTNTNDAEPNTYVFEYIQKAAVGYTVRYVNSLTGEDVSAPKIVTSNYSIVSEHFVYVEGMISDAVSKTLVLAAYETVEEEYQNNVITFYYTENTTDALYQINHNIQNVDLNGYSLYSTETRIVDINTVINPSDSAISIPGFAFVPDITKVEGEIAEGASVADGNKLIIDLYYDRLTYGYVVYYREYGNESNILATIADDTKHIIGTKVSHTAPESVTDVNNDVYTIVGDTERTIEIRAESGDVITLNVINVYYQKKTFYTVNYKAVCIPETSDNFGQVSLSYEIVDSDSQPQGSAAMVSDNVRYSFKGWYSDDKGERLVSKEITFKPSIAQDATYYAIFSVNTTDLTIIQSGGSPDDNFLYKIIDENDSELIVTVKGGGSVTIKDLPCGDYTITEITQWDWRYNPDSEGSEKLIKAEENANNSVTFTNSPNDKNWLGGESDKDNIFNQ